MAKSYLYAVQDQDGRELTSVVLEPEKLRDVTASCNEAKDTVMIFHAGVEVRRATVPNTAETLDLCRWPADAKLSDPVRKRAC
jgi:hypothetical protein